MSRFTKVDKRARVYHFCCCFWYHSIQLYVEKFWLKLSEHWQASNSEEEKLGVARSLKKAKLFVQKYTQSLHKHNKQFISSDLFFIACFGEHETSKWIARLFQDD